MGWIDFLKKKGAAQRNQLAREAGNKSARPSVQPRLWHYFLTHFALRDLAVKGGFDKAALADPARVKEVLAQALARMAPKLQLSEDDAAAQIASIAIVARRFFSDAAGLVVTMPPPMAPSEAHFAAVVGPAPGRAEPIRYFTLEDAGGDTTAFCEWTADDVRHRFEECPFASAENFVAAINEKL